MAQFTLAQWRKARGISQAQMAEMLNVHVNTYINWEKEPLHMKVSQALQCAGILEVALADIIF